MPRKLSLPYDQLGSAYLAGQSTTTLARRYSCSPTTIAKILRRCGITPRPSQFAPAQIEEAALRHLYLDERWPVAAIAVHFGVSPSTIGNQRRRYGIAIRPRRAREEAGEKEEAERAERERGTT